MFCENCGAQIADNAKFCENCGAATDVPAHPSYAPRLVGFSQRIHDPVFEKLQKESFRRSVKHGLFFLPIVILLFQIGPFFSDDFTHPRALIVGCIVGGFGLVCTLIGGMKRASASTWDGEVIDKKITEHTTRRQNDSVDTHFMHTIFFSLPGGGRKKMQRKLLTGGLNAWDMMVYLNIGDKVRYHGKLDYYEKYDKSRDAEVPCANCRKFVDIRLDKCPHCQVPVIKP